MWRLCGWDWCCPSLSQLGRTKCVWEGKASCNLNQGREARRLHLEEVVSIFFLNPFLSSVECFRERPRPKDRWTRAGFLPYTGVKGNYWHHTENQLVGRHSHSSCRTLSLYLFFPLFCMGGSWVGTTFPLAPLQLGCPAGYVRLPGPISKMTTWFFPSFSTTRRWWQSEQTERDEVTDAILLAYSLC